MLLPNAWDVASARRRGSGSGAEEQRDADLVSEALRRVHAYVEAGADCVFPILLWQPDALKRFISEAAGPVSVLNSPRAPSHSELAELGVGRISYGVLTHRNAIEQFGRLLAATAPNPGALPGSNDSTHPPPGSSSASTSRSRGAEEEREMQRSAKIAEAGRPVG